MPGMLDAVDRRTQMSGENRLELLLFKLDKEQLYGINVFKVKEILPCPRLNILPHSHPAIKGVACVRGGTIPVMDLSMVTGGEGIDEEGSFVILTEYSGHVQGFLVRTVEKIINTNWTDIHVPPKGVENSSYLTAVTEVEKKLVEILDVERILTEVSVTEAVMTADRVSSELKAKVIELELEVLLVDDSVVARKQMQGVITEIGLKSHVLNDGLAALTHLQELAADGIKADDKYIMILSDVEMPEMDGYTLTATIRENEYLKNLYIVLHTSLSGVFNKAMVNKVGADEFIPKFDPDHLADCVLGRIERYLSVKGL